VIKELSKIASNWRSSRGLADYLALHNVVGIEGIDTRAVTKHIRTAGAMKAVISTECLDETTLIKKAQDAPGLPGRDLVKEVTCKERYQWHEGEKRSAGRFKVVALDCGIKMNIIRKLYQAGCEVTVVVVETVKSLLGTLPIFGICFGHQILGQAFGGKTYKLKFGHRGGNQPVKDLATGKVSITSQNHGFCVDMESITDDGSELTYINLNDHTLEGMRHKTHPVFSVQYHPEASPGPHDTDYLFKTFIQLMERWSSA
jgi:carbamoyl-phosphate synthase small subunit